MFMPYIANGRLVCWYILDTYDVYAYTLPCAAVVFYLLINLPWINVTLYCPLCGSYGIVCRTVMDQDRPCKVVLLTLLVVSMGVTEGESSRTINVEQARTAYHTNCTTEHQLLHQARPKHHVPCEI